MTRDPVVLAGPTASGKSRVAMALAERLGGEIISVDSIQVYRGLDIGSAKPTPEDRARIPHHLIDVVGIESQFDAARFAAAAHVAVADIQARGGIPILCGGTGLYFNAWLHGLGSAPPPDPALRAALEAVPLAELLDELARRDPATFDEIDAGNPRRVIRAVEVLRLTGKPFSQQRSRWPEKAASLAGRAFGLNRDRDDLRRRIDHRVDGMFRAGLVDETRGLLAVGLEGNRNAMQAIGYRQVVEHLSGRRGRLETMELVKVRTAQFARRQMTWFRAQMDVDWIDVGADESGWGVAERILERMGMAGS